MGDTVTRQAAPAKLNLWLRVRGRRPDGLHELQSLVVPLDWGDEVTVAVALEAAPGPAADPDPNADVRGEDEVRDQPTGRGQNDVRCVCPAAPELQGPANLAARAAEALLAHHPGRWRCRIHLRKRIPVAAGLGGGSADAAATLRALARLLARRGSAPHADAPALSELAAFLGADVPVCLRGVPAWVAGWGQLVTPAPALPPFALCLIHPPVQIPTRSVFAALDAPPLGSPDPVAPTAPRSLEQVCRLVHNDLWPTVRSLYPDLAAPWAALARRRPLAQALSGSGPTLFGIFADRPQARVAAAALRKEGLSARACQPADVLDPPDPHVE